MGGEWRKKKNESVEEKREEKRGDRQAYQEDRIVVPSR